MMSRRPIPSRRPATAYVAVAAVIAAVAVIGWLARSMCAPQPAPSAAQPAVRNAWRVVWRAALTAHANAPVPVDAEGWIVTDDAGGVTRLSDTGKPLWRVSFSNQPFEASAAIHDRRVFAASTSGGVLALDAETGRALWSVTLDARFQHPPLLDAQGGGDAAVMRLVSQSDGRLFCLRVRDGLTLWQSEPTNRCDGEPAAGPYGIAYGNCDGAIHVFDAADGRRKGSIPVGTEDQMAGGLLSLPDSRLVAGTRQGNLVVANAQTFVCEARTRVSENEAFLKPVRTQNGLIATGSEEGLVSLWFLRDTTLSQAGEYRFEQAIRDLAACGNRLFILTGGALHIADTPDAAVCRVALGDEVYGLALRDCVTAACVADGMLVCVKGEAHE